MAKEDKLNGMMAQTFEPIETPVGIISGRDAFYLDEIHFDYRGNGVRLEGEINGHLCSRNENNREWIRYSLVFSGVLGFRMVELDFSRFFDPASFVRVIYSEWVAEMRDNDSASKVTPEHVHYILRTYDDVFDVICRDYNFAIS